MSEDFIQLTCRSCGGKLNVYDDTDRFACASCGVEMIVHRRGGTVALSAVTDAIKQVQAGTDKVAAELALARLSAESDALHARASDLRVKSSKAFTCIVAAIGCFLVGLMLSSTNAGQGLVVFSVIAGGFNYLKKKGCQQILTEVRHQLRHVEGEMQKHRMIVNG